MDEIGKIYCPLCEGEMDYKQNKETHIWSCQECPALLFEYYGEEDIENLKEI